MKKRLFGTLIIIDAGEQLLLGVKKRGFGAGKINGVGGKLEPGETFLEAVIRETQEELTVVPTGVQEVGVIEFDEVVKGERCIVEMHVFTATGYEGHPQETEEIIPHFVDKNKIPYDKMFPDDRIWLPELLKGRKFKGVFLYDDDLNIMNVNIEFFE